MLPMLDPLKIFKQQKRKKEKLDLPPSIIFLWTPSKKIWPRGKKYLKKVHGNGATIRMGWEIQFLQYVRFSITNL